MRADKRSRPPLVMIVLLAWVVSTGAAPGARRQPHEFASLDRALAHSLRDTGTSGVSAAVIFADGSRWTGTAGLADVQMLRRRFRGFINSRIHAIQIDSQFEKLL